jgi:hypothetical protein
MSEFSADFLLGATAIANKLKQLGLIAENDENAEDKVYYAARTKKLPIGRFGKSLIASGTKLEQTVRRLVA